MNYQNPIIPGFYPDPSIVRVQDDYYIVTSSFEYVPAVPLFHSKDLINWTQIGNVLDRPSQQFMGDTFCSGGIYAPTIRYHDGVFYMITTCLTKTSIQNFFVKTKDISKGWSDPILLSFGGIDPSLYFEQDRVYAHFASADETGKKCIKQVELDMETGACLSEEKILTYGTGGRDVEGPHLYQLFGYYYLLCAEGGTREGHMITIHRSKELWGPYEAYEHNPIATNRDCADRILQGIGHGDFVEDHNGAWWMVCLGYRSVKHTHVTGRETLLVPISWNEEHWPVVEDGIVKEEYAFEGTTKQMRDTSVQERFDQETLGSAWLMLRDAKKVHYECHQNQLILYGNQETLQDIGTPAFLALRQRDLLCEWRVQINVTGMKQGEAGIALYMDNHHHIELGIYKKEEGYYAFVRKTVGEISIISKELPLTKEIVMLSVIADRQTYTCMIDAQIVDWTQCKHLSTEVADAPFNGVVCGMYVYGKNTFARYHQFDYIPMEETRKETDG